MYGSNDNKKFRKNVKPAFGNIVKGNKTINLVKGNEVITNDRKLDQTSVYLINILHCEYRSTPRYHFSS